MSGRVIFDGLWIVAFVVIAWATWLNSTKFRALYPKFRSGPFWGVLSASPLAISSAAYDLANIRLGETLGRDSLAVMAVAGLPLLAGMLLIDLVPHTRRAVVAFNQHLMGRAVTGRMFPPKSERRL